MNVLCVFSGQGDQQDNIYSFFEKDKQALAYLQQLSHVMNLRDETVSCFDPHYSQFIISRYQLTLFHMIQPLLASHTLNVAGYSLGEVSAFLASTKASMADINAIITYRTQLMTSLLREKDAVAYDLLSIYGPFNINDIEKICLECHCYIAIINDDKRLVLGGAVHNLNQLRHVLPQSIKTHFLSVHLPSHTPFYADKKGEFRTFLQSSALKILHYPIISPLQLGKIYSVEEEMERLDQELYSPIHWSQVCALIKEYYYDLIIDLGPSNAMSLFLNPQIDSSRIISAADYKNSIGFNTALHARLSI